MKNELKKLSENEGEDIYEMIKEIGLGENGFINNFPSTSYEDFTKSLPRLVEVSNGINLEEGYVPQTIYWMYIDDQPVAYGKLRHSLNEKLAAYGGHVGYMVRPTERGKGYGKLFLKGLINEAKLMGIDKLLITCDESNARSRGVVESNNGKLEDINDGICRYWITI